MAVYADDKADAIEPVIQESQSPQKMSVRQYATTRFSTLKPPMNKAPNPVKLLMMLNGKQWLFFLCGFIAWVCVETLIPWILAGSTSDP